MMNRNFLQCLLLCGGLCVLLAAPAMAEAVAEENATPPTTETATTETAPGDATPDDATPTEATPAETTPTEATPTGTISFDIAAQPLAEALKAWEAQSGWKVEIEAELTAGKTAPEVQGTLSPADALRELLAGSGLQAFEEENVFVIEAAEKTITITGDVNRETATGPVQGYVAKRAATATKTDTPIIETPQSISVVPSDQLEVQGVDQYSEAFRYTPGAQGEPFGLETRRTWLRLRGFDASTDGLYKDGLKLANNNFIAAYALEPYGAERLDVLKGPASVLYGQGNPGGLVNYITKRPLFAPLHEVILEGGRFKRYQGQFDTTGPLNEKGTLAYRLTGLFRDSETQIDFVNDDRVYAAPALTWRPSDNTSITLLAHYLRDRTKEYQFLPIQGTLFNNPNGRIPSNRYTGEPDVDGFDRDEFSIGYLAEHRFNQKLQFRQNLRFHNQDKDSVTVYLVGLLPDQRTITRSRFDQDASTRGVTLDNQLVADFETGSIKHKLLAGVDYQYLGTSSIEADGPVADLDVYDPVYGGPAPAGAVYLDQDSALRQTGLYLQNQLNLTEKLILSLGGRYDFTKSKVEDNLTGTTTDQDDKKFTGRVGVLYKLASGVSPYASYTTSFLPILGTDIAGNQFVPETAKQWEVGVKFQPRGRDTIFTLAYFDLTRRNFLTFAPPRTAIQNGEGKSRGIEFEARSDFDNGLSLIAAYTYLDTKLTRSAFPAEVGEPLGHTPKHQASLWTDYLFKKGRLKNLRLGGGVRYLGSRYGDLFQQNNRDIKVPDTVLFDAAVHYNWERFKAALTIHNVTDKQYVSGATSSVGYEGLRRAIRFSVGYDF